MLRRCSGKAQRNSALRSNSATLLIFPLLDERGPKRVVYPRINSRCEHGQNHSLESHFMVGQICSRAKDPRLALA
jgi:hypothetical protein